MMRIHGLATAALIAVTSSCAAPPAELSTEHAAAMRDSVVAMAGSIATALSQDGPAAWLRYFERDPGFFMASDGAMAFPSNDSADTFVADLAGRFASMELTWEDVRVEPVAPSLAVLAASYNESIVDTSGSELRFGGFFTALAIHTSQGWRLQNLHWSSPR